MTSWLESIPTLPALVPGRVSHERFEARNHAFEYRHPMWLIDVDAPPNLGAGARFLASDHLGSGETFRVNVAAFVREHGDSLEVRSDDQIILLTNPRTFGKVFNPLSVYWVLRAGAVLCLIAEIHNTYGERHAHLIVPPDTNPTSSRARVPKQFYVSPFFDVSGEYRMTFGLTPGSVRIGITLERKGRVVFTASFLGSPQVVTRSNLFRAGVRTLFIAHRTTALIRIHGIWLWLRGLPVQRRKPHQTPKAV